MNCEDEIDQYWRELNRAIREEIQREIDKEILEILTRQKIMTTPTERYNSLMKTKKLLEDILQYSESIPREEIADRAYKCLRHFPWEYHLDVIADECPEILEKPE